MNGLTKSEAMHILTQWVPKLKKVLFYASTPPRLVLVVDGIRGEQQIDLGSRPPSQMAVRWGILAATGQLPPPVAQGAWESVLMAMAAAVEIVEAPESDEWDELLETIARYLESRRPVDEHDPVAFAAAHRYDEPVIYRGAVCVNATALALWARGRGGNRSPREMALLLRRYGAEPVFIHVWDKNGKGSRGRRYWALPAPLLPEGVRMRLEGAEEEGAESLANSNPLHIYTSQEDVLRKENAVQDKENGGSSTHLQNPQGEHKTSVDVLMNGEKAHPDAENVIYRSSQRSVDVLRHTPPEQKNTGENLEWEVL